MKFSVYQISRQGGRERNEDRMGYAYTRESGLFVLADGRARLVLRSDDQSDLQVLDHGPGEILGALGEVEASDYDVVVVAAGDCRVVRIPADAAATALASSAGLAAALDQLGVSRRRRCDRALRRAERQLGIAPGSPDVTTGEPGSAESS